LRYDIRFHFEKEKEVRMPRDGCIEKPYGMWITITIG